MKQLLAALLITTATMSFAEDTTYILQVDFNGDIHHFDKESDYEFTLMLLEEFGNRGETLDEALDAYNTSIMGEGQHWTLSNGMPFYGTEDGYNYAEADLADDDELNGSVR